MSDFPSLKEADGQPIVYVRAVKVADLPSEVQDQAEGMEAIYSVSDADGRVIALVDDRTRAFALARMNELQPVSVH
ncbi:DUF1150 family protein [Algicella marina]|uniref:DUF1150 family protein n=1 Tax=Algicella marina TaxID=2683284 RepID=A0A6P1SVL5_9RHOB|nr:DUF1150 family protein [Algicella marina]QHQ33700.1 DUF1150 family protein [Algicella marina]